MPDNLARPIWRYVLLAAFLPWCWLAMMAVHELGHVIAAVVTGGNVCKVIVHPLSISRTDLSENPFPGIVVWSGPVFGVIVPVLSWRTLAFCRAPGVHLSRFFAGFCLIANGAYIGIGSFDAVGDAGDMLRLGHPIVGLWLFGIVASTSGLALWNRLGVEFGYGVTAKPVDGSLAFAVICLSLISFAMALAFSPR